MKTRILLAAVLAAMVGPVALEGARAADLANLVEGCAACHGKDGASTEPEVPIIGGLSATFIEFNLTAYGKSERPCPDLKFKSGPKKGSRTTMCEVVKGLGDGNIGAVAKYFAGQKFVRANQDFDPELARRGKAIHKQACEKCHSSDGSDPNDDAGILAGQWKGYLLASFEEFSSGKRPMEQKMKPKIQKLDQAGFEALANYFASFK